LTLYEIDLDHALHPVFRYHVSSQSVAGRREIVHRRVVRTEAFKQSAAALNDSESRLVLDAMIVRIMHWPLAGYPIEGTRARVLRSLSHGNFRIVRLIYRVEGDVIYLYRAGCSDALQVVPRGYA
jgi:hypothetical protein